VDLIEEKRKRKFEQNLRDQMKFIDYAPVMFLSAKTGQGVKDLFKLIREVDCSEMVELSTAHTRKQFETFTGQSKELAAIAQKVATESAEPVKESWGKAFKKIPEFPASSANSLVLPSRAHRPGFIVPRTPRPCCDR